MPEFDPAAEPETTEEQIVHATYRALCEYGYAGLTVQRIGEKFPKSKSLLYHHYEGKDELLLEFLSYMLEGFQSEVESPEEIEDPEATLREALHFSLDPDRSEEGSDFLEAMTELRAQAAHDEDYREYFTRSDRTFRDAYAAIIERGIEEGTFREVDPDRAGAFLHSLAVGSMTRESTADDVDVEAVRAAADEYVDDVLLADRE